MTEACCATYSADVRSHCTTSSTVRRNGIFWLGCWHALSDGCADGCICGSESNEQRPPVSHRMCAALCRHKPVKPATWQDVKGVSVLVGNYEESVKVRCDRNP